MVKDVVGSKDNQVALLDLLENNFARVNSDWLEGYQRRIKDNAKKITSVEIIQRQIDLINDSELGKRTIADNTNKENLLETKELLEKYATPELDKDKNEVQTEATKKALKDIEIQLAVIEVTEASTPNRLKSALTKLDELVAKDDKFMAEKKDASGKVTYKGYVDANAKLYFEVDADNSKVADFKEITDVAGANALIVNGNAKAEELEAGKEAEAKADLLKELNKTTKDTPAADVLAILQDELFDLDDVNEDYAEAYKARFVFLENDVAEESLQAVVNYVNEKENAKAGIVSTRAELDVALENEEIKTITLKDGKYDTNDLEITREVTLKAENKHKAILPHVELNSDDVTIDGVQASSINYKGNNVTITNNVVTSTTKTSNTVAIAGTHGVYHGPVTITNNRVLAGSIGLNPTKDFDKYTITGNIIEKLHADGIEGIWIAFDHNKEVIMTVDEADNMAEQLVKDNNFGTFFADEDLDPKYNKVKVQYKAGSDTVMRYAN